MTTLMRRLGQPVSGFGTIGAWKTSGTLNVLLGILGGSWVVISRAISRVTILKPILGTYKHTYNYP